MSLHSNLAFRYLQCGKVLIIPVFVNAGALKESSKRETGCTDPAPPLSIRSDAKFEVPTGFLTTGTVGLFSCTRVGGFGAGTGGGGG